MYQERDRKIYENVKKQYNKLKRDTKQIIDKSRYVIPFQVYKLWWIIAFISVIVVIITMVINIMCNTNTCRLKQNAFEHTNISLLDYIHSHY